MGVFVGLMTDQELLAKIRDGDSAAVAELYERYAPMVARYLSARMRRDVHACEDVLSETFLGAIKALNSGATPRNLAGWLTLISRNKLVDWQRIRQRRGESSISLETEARHASSELVADVLDALPDTERVVLEWKYLDRCTVGEIAARLGRTEKAVEGLLYRARNAFRTHYETVSDC
ncbi:MAG TPA: RNA polymerase subunit sigma-24 [Planctomycetaceae bacterium]|nr:RNA polymerase subunit sigma-24 [Planctomycetaceae bacterium]